MSIRNLPEWKALESLLVAHKQVLALTHDYTQKIEAENAKSNWGYVEQIGNTVDLTPDVLDALLALAKRVREHSEGAEDIRVCSARGYGDWEEETGLRLWGEIECPKPPPTTVRCPLCGNTTEVDSLSKQMVGPATVQNCQFCYEPFLIMPDGTVGTLPAPVLVDEFGVNPSAASVNNGAVKFLDELDDLISFVNIAVVGVGMCQSPNIKAKDEHTWNFAKKEFESDLSYTYQLATVQLWAILETHMDDTAILTLSAPNTLKGNEQLAKIKVSLSEFTLAAQEGNVARLGEMLLQAIKQDVKSPLKSGVGKFESIFSVLGIGGSIDENVRKALLEFSAARNLAVHQNSRVDKRFLRECSWTGLKEGDLFKFDSDRFTMYREAARWYSWEISRRGAARMIDNGEDLGDDVASPEDHLKVMNKAAKQVASIINVLYPPENKV